MGPLALEIPTEKGEDALATSKVEHGWIQRTGRVSDKAEIG